MQSAVGKVVAVEERRVANLSHGRWTEPDTAYQPILRFTTATGEVREFRSAAGKFGRSSPYTLGMTFPMLYDPDDVLPPAIDSWFDSGEAISQASSLVRSSWAAL